MKDLVDSFVRFSVEAFTLAVCIILWILLMASLAAAVGLLTSLI